MNSLQILLFITCYIITIEASKESENIHPLQRVSRNNSNLFSSSFSEVYSNIRGGLTKSISVELEKKKVESDKDHFSVFVSFKINNWSGCSSSYYYVGGVVSNIENIRDEDIKPDPVPIFGCEREAEFKIDEKMDDDYYKYFTLGVYDDRKKLVARKTIALTGFNAADMGVIVLTVFTVIMIIGLLLWTFCYCGYRRNKKNVILTVILTFQIFLILFMNKGLSLFLFAFSICISSIYALKINTVSITSLDTQNLRSNGILGYSIAANGSVSVSLKYVSSKLSGDSLDVNVDINIKNVDNCSDIPVVSLIYGSKDIPQKEIDDAILKSDLHMKSCSGRFMLNFKVSDNLPNVYYMYFGVLTSERKVAVSEILKLNKPSTNGNKMDVWSYCVIALAIFAFLMVTGLIGWTVFYCRKRKQTTTQESKGIIGESLLKSNTDDSDDD